MNIENELKFISTKAVKIEQVINALKENGFDIPERVKQVHQEDTYFDDKHGSLEKSGGSFRIRRKKDKVQITCKIPVISDTEYKQRKEYEITVPEEFLQEGQKIELATAIKLLKEQYPELKLPGKMKEILTVINDRQKLNLTCSDGTLIEMAVDTLKGKDGNGNLYDINPEIEFETKSGKSENLSRVYSIINENFSQQLRRNTLSKYARTKKEISEKQLTLEEVSVCAIFTEILNSEEYNRLQYKGQILHRYDKPTTTNLDNFKNFDYLAETLGKIKRGEYKVAIPRAVAENPELTTLLKDENYETKDKINLEEMVCLLLSNVKYKVSDEVLANFLNENYYGLNNAMTNRLSHSQQIMLASGLIAKSSEVEANFEDKLTCMISGLSHDIGHVPMAHTLESLLKEMDGLFSHEMNGKITIENIVKQSKPRLIMQIREYFPQMSTQNIETILEGKAIEIEDAVANHSRKGSDKRREGVNNQAAREADKICYAVSDICDLIRFGKEVQGKNVDVLEEGWLNNAVLEICKGNESFANDIMKMLETQYIKYLKNGDYGRAVVNSINSIEAIERDGIIQYDVNHKIWKFIEKLIARAKDVRESMKIEQSKDKMSKSAIAFIIEEFYKEYKENNGNIDLAWEKLLSSITKMGELDILEYVKEKSKLECLTSKETISPIEKEQIIQAIAERTYNMSKIKGKADEEASTTASNVKVALEKLTPEQVLQYFKKYKFYSEVPIEPIINQLHSRADIQLKLNPREYGFLSKLWKDLNFNPDVIKRKIISDQYYEVKRKGSNPRNTIIKVRKIKGEENKTLIVKIPVKKNVRERITRTYKTQVASDVTIDEMIRKINEENVGLNIELASDKPYETIDITRLEFTGMYGADEITFTQDEFKGENDIVMEEVEIKCPKNPKIITNIKSKIKEKYQSLFVVKSKIRRVQDAARARD